MAKYTVELTAPSGHSIPTLLQSFGNWLAKQEYGSLGYFDLCVESVPEEWDPESADRLSRDGFCFLGLPDGSMLVLLKTRPNDPPAVVLLGSEGATNTVATSLEEFLVLLGNGETGIDELDEEEATGRSKLRAWLTKNKIQAPKAPAFDFDAYLDGVSSTPPQSDTKPELAADVISGLPPLIQQIATLTGCRADDPKLACFVKDVLEKKVPDSTTDVGGMKYIVAPKKGLELGFHHDIKNLKYPLVKKSKNSYVPYLSIVWLKAKVPERLPFGLKFDMSVEELTSVLGPPRFLGTSRRPTWERVLDPARDIVFSVDPKSVTIEVQQAMELAMSEVPGRTLLGLFVAWAILRDLLDLERFRDHTALVAAVRNRAQQGSALVDAALPRGLWDSHLKDEPGLRDFAFAWFHNMDDLYINDDLIAVFGVREGSTGHDEPVLDDDDWPAVDKAIPTLDRRFAQWVKKTTVNSKRK